MSWFDEQDSNDTALLKCPMTGQRLASDSVYPNIALRTTIEEFCQTHHIVLPEVAPPEPAPVSENGFTRRRRVGQAEGRRVDPENDVTAVSIGFGYLPSVVALAWQDWRTSIAHDDLTSLQVSGGHRIVMAIATILTLGIILF